MCNRMRARPDTGFTLIEVLIAMVVLGSGVVALVTALGVNAKTTLGNRNQSQASSTLAAAAEYVKSLAWTDSTIACGAPTTTLSVAQLKHDPAFTVTYGPAAAVNTTSCTLLRTVPISVVGSGYNLSVNVLRRPESLP